MSTCNPRGIGNWRNRFRVTRKSISIRCHEANKTSRALRSRSARRRCGSRVNYLQSEPIAIEAIPVNVTAARLFFLHGTQWGDTDSDRSRMALRSENTRFTTMTGSVTSIPIRYGLDVRDWDDHDQGRPAARATLAWRGMNRSEHDQSEDPNLPGRLEESLSGEEDRQPGLCLDDDQGLAVLRCDHRRRIFVHAG